MSITTLRLCDTATALVDALAALKLATRSLDDPDDQRGLSFLVEHAREIAETIDDKAAALHAGIPDDDDDGDHDADLLNLITAWRVQDERVVETDNAPDMVERSHRLLAKIAATEARTVCGALAKARICYDDHEIEREMQDGAPIERVGASGLRDLFRITGEADDAKP